jgi:hypothetical protein
MNCPDAICRLVTCPVTDDIPSYLGAYSLQTGTQYVNLAISVPIEGGFYIAPPGSIVINLPPSPSVAAYQGCLSGISEAIPTGSTPAQILAIVSSVMNQVAAQQSICNAPKPVLSPFLLGSFTNGPQFAPCGAGMSMQQIGDLPPGVTFSVSGISVVGGLFSSSVSQAAADAAASAYLDTFFGTSVECGWWNTPQSFTCPDGSVKTVDADTYFSLVSQDDANAQALAAATAECTPVDCASALVGLVWTITQSNPIGGFNNGAVIAASASGDNGVMHVISTNSIPNQAAALDVTFSATIVNNNTSDCHYLVGRNTTLVCTAGNAAGCGADLAYGIVTVNGTTMQSQFIDGTCTQQSTAYAPVAITVPAMSSLLVEIVASTSSGGPLPNSDNGIVNGTFKIVPA